MRWATDTVLEQLERLDSEPADRIESETLEFKSPPRDPEELARWAADAAVCLANHRGGAVVFGIRDRVLGRNNAIAGIGSLSTSFLQRSIYDSTDPSILIDTDELVVPEGRLLVMHVPKGMPPHTTSAGKATIRIGNACVPLTGSRLAQIVSESGEVDLTAVPVTDMSGDCLSRRALDEARRLLRQQPNLAALADREDEELLAGLNLVRDGRLTRAALLLVGSEDAIARHVPQHEITLLRYQTSTRYQERRDLRGAFLEELSRLEDFLISVTAIRTVQPPGLAQLEIRTITSEVAREAILNAVAHRDYFIRQGVVVAVHRSGVEVTNPGGFIGGVTPDNVLHHRAVHRNELLARAFQNLRLVDRVGMGVNRMYEGLLRSGARPPSFEADQGSVSVRLPTDASDDFVAWIYEHERRNGPLSLNDLVVLRRVTDAGTLDRWTAAHQLQLDEHSAADHLAEMRSRGLLVARGRGRGTSYVLPRPLSERLRGRAATDADRPLEMEGVRLKVLELLREREHLTNAEIRDFSGYSRAQVLAIEKDLERQGLIEIKGRGRGAHIVLAPPE